MPCMLKTHFSFLLSFFSPSSRGVVRERLKKVLPDVILALKDQGLSAGFTDHPSKDTTLDWRNMHPVVSPIEGNTNNNNS